MKLATVLPACREIKALDLRYNSLTLAMIQAILVPAAGNSRVFV